MRLPAPIVTFVGTWVGMLLLFGLQAAYSVATAREPDIKFGSSAPYVGLVLIGGLGGFLAATSALVATFIFEEKQELSLNFTRAARVSAMAAVPFAFIAWYAATSSSLPVIGTLVAMFVICTAIFFALLHATQRPKGDA